MPTLQNLKDFKNWEKQRVVTFKKNDLPAVYLLIEYNQFYGELVTTFQIGDDIGTTGVNCRYGGKPLELMESNNQTGEREFKHNSITREFLWDALGLEMLEDEWFEKHGKELKTVKNTSLYTIGEALRRKGYAVHKG